MDISILHMILCRLGFHVWETKSSVKDISTSPRVSLWVTQHTVTCMVCKKKKGRP